MFLKIGVLKSYVIFTGKHLCWSFFFNKVAGLVLESLFNKVRKTLLKRDSNLRPATLLKKRLQHRCFPVNIAKFLRTAFFIEDLRWLLLKVAVYRLDHIFPVVSNANYELVTASLVGMIIVCQAQLLFTF